MSTDKTVTELTQDILTRLSMVDGTSVQLYAEDRILQEIQHTFDFIFEEAYWPQYSSWQTGELNETTGVVTADITSILKRWEDLLGVWYEDYQRPLPQLPNNFNPYGITGTEPKFVEPTSIAGKIFSVRPVASTGNVRFYVRTKPADFVAASVPGFDSEALILGTVYGILEDDGDNPGATEKFHRKFEARMQQLQFSAFHQQPASLNPYSASVSVPKLPAQWFETP